MMKLTTFTLIFYINQISLPSNSPEESVCVFVGDGRGGGVLITEVWPNICKYRQITGGCGAQKNDVFIDKSEADSLLPFASFNPIDASISTETLHPA